MEFRSPKVAGVVSEPRREPAAGQPSRGETLPLRGGATPAARKGKVKVSVMIPTLNEESNMPRCLDHLQWADEVVVVDSGSADRTVEIAQAYGCRVVDFDWNGQWPKKKNWALRHVDFKHEWVLIVDADEWIMPDLAAEIARVIERSDRVGYYVNRRFIFMGRWIRHCGYYPSWNLRLIKRGFGEYEQLTGVGNTGSGDNEVHEHVVPTGEVGYLGSDMLHFAFPTIHTFIEKHNRYSNWEAAVQFRGADADSSAIGTELSRRRRLKNLSRKLPFRPALRFLYSYVVKGGVLDGQPGYVFCRLLAIYEYLSVAKYVELKRAEDDRRMARSLSKVPEWDWRTQGDPVHASPLSQPAEPVAEGVAGDNGSGSAPRSTAGSVEVEVER
jgi:glycosyltransferase involved in cell wall biosynthesis